MKLLKAIEICDSTILKKVLLALERRVFWLECREPEYEGVTYDKWEEKLEELKTICEEIEEYLNNKIELDVKDIWNSIREYQLNYGGLRNIELEGE